MLKEFSEYANDSSVALALRLITKEDSNPSMLLARKC